MTCIDQPDIYIYIYIYIDITIYSSELFRAVMRDTYSSSFSVASYFGSSDSERQLILLLFLPAGLERAFDFGI